MKELTKIAAVIGILAALATPTVYVVSKISTLEKGAEALEAEAKTRGELQKEVAEFSKALATFNAVFPLYVTKIEDHETRVRKLEHHSFGPPDREGR